MLTSSKNHKKRPTLDDLAKIAFKERKEMEQHMAKVKIDCALQHEVPPAADATYKQNDKVLIWREKLVNKRITA